MLTKIHLPVLFFALVVTLAACTNELERTLKNPDVTTRYTKAISLYDAGKYADSKALLETVMPMMKGTPKAQEAFWYYADVHYKLREYLSAAYYYKTFASTFPNSDKAEEAQYMSANCYYRLSPTPMLDQDYTTKAIEAFQIYVNTYPTSKHAEEGTRSIDELREKLYRKDYDAAELYFKIGYYQAAVHSLRNLLKNYPDAHDAEKARYLIVKSYYFLAQNTVEVKQAERYQETLAAYLELVDKHPGGKYAKEASKIFDAATTRLKELQ